MTTYRLPAAFGGLFVLLWIAAIGGYIANIVKLVGLIGSEVTTMFVLRAIGVIAAPLGMVLGYLYRNNMSQTIFKGFVAKLGKKEGTGKRGPWTLYSAKLEKEDGTEYQEWISFGFDDPGIAEGDYIEVKAVQDNGRWKAEQHRKPKNPPARKPKAQGQGGGGFRKGFGGGGFGKSPTNPEDVKRIAYANARDHAIRIVDLLLANDALPLTKASTKAGEAVRYEEILAAVNKLTVQLQIDGTTLRLLESVADAGASKKPDVGKLPETETSDEEESFEDDKPADADGEDDGWGDDE